MSAHPCGSIRRAPRNAREAHSAMTATAAKRDAAHADLRHLHSRTSIPAWWRHDRRPAGPSLTPEATRWLRWIIAALVAFWGGVGIAVSRWMA